MPRLSDEFIDELKSKADIEQVISSYVTLKRTGKNLQGLCPFHNEKTPSFSVSPDKQLYHCFGCGASGTVITFIKEMENLDFYDAVKLLCDRYGVRMPSDNGIDDSLSLRRRKIKEINRAAAKYFHSMLFSESGKACLDYLYKREITLKTIKHFGLGYAPDGWRGLADYMTENGYSKQELSDAGLVRKSDKGASSVYYDNFRNRMMIPLIDVNGDVLAFSGRVLDESKPKYINTPDTPVYKKSDRLFALNFAKNKNDGRLLLAEGGMDVIALHQAGFTNAVASFGTALTQEQARLISRYANEVVIVYDNDEAGRKAVEKASALLSQTGVKIKIPRLSGGKDPDEIIKKFGAERFKGMLDGAANDIEYKLLAQREKYDVNTSDGKKDFLHSAAKILADIKNSIDCEVYTGEIAQEMNISKEVLQHKIEEIRSSTAKRIQKERFDAVKKNIRGYNDKVNRERSLSVKGTRAEEELLATLLKSPDFLKKGLQITSDDFITEFNKNLFNIIQSRINEGAGVDIMYFGAELSKSELDRLVEIEYEAAKIQSNISIESYNGCVRAIKEEKERLGRTSATQMTDEEFLAAFRKINK